MDFRKIVRNQNLLSGILLVLIGIMFLLTPTYSLASVVRIGGWLLPALCFAESYFSEGTCLPGSD